MDVSFRRTWAIKLEGEVLFNLPCDDMRVCAWGCAPWLEQAGVPLSRNGLTCDAVYATLVSAVHWLNTTLGPRLLNYKNALLQSYLPLPLCY